MSSVSQELKETGPEGPASCRFVMVYTRFSELIGHSLLGDQEDDGREDQDAADHIEDRGTDTTGARKDCLLDIEIILWFMFYMPKTKVCVIAQQLAFKSLLLVSL